MAVRVRKGGVYDWTLPGPNRGQDSVFRRRSVTVRPVITAVPRWSRKGKREVRMRDGGQVIGFIERSGAWRLYATAVNAKEDVTGTAKTFQGAMKAMALAL